MTGQLGTFQDIGFQIETQMKLIPKKLNGFAGKAAITLQPAISPKS